MRKYYYCKSYQIFLLAFKEVVDGTDVTVITPSEDIVQACKYLKIKFITHKTFSLRDIIFKRKYVLSELKNIVAIVDGSPFYFSHTQFTVFLFILLQQLSLKRINSNFYNFELMYEEINRFIFNKPFMAKYFVKALIKYLYGTDLVIKKNGNAYLLGINEKIIEELGCTVIDNKDSYYDVVYAGLKNYQAPVRKYDYLFVSQNLHRYTLVNREFYANIVKIVRDRNMIVKLHPNMDEQDIFSTCDKAPYFLPVELFYNNIRKAVISVHSAALTNASKYPHLKAISLFELVKTDDEAFNRTTIKYLRDNSNGKIIFPKTIKEFEELLNEN